MVFGVLLAAGIGSSARAGIAVPQPSFFDSIEVRAENLAPFRKWNSALARYSTESERSVDGDCSPNAFRVCPYRDWLSFLDGLRNADRWYQLQAVNHEMNKRRYVTDPVNWGVEDYWESPGEFLVRDGDCEDYAIAKYLSLKRLGWSDENLRVVAVRDLNLNVGHAVLIAYYEGATWLLDNQVGTVINTDRVTHYQPVFSINETAWWRHRPR
jgi:predicted transglutaminase-like cysteine proteinase